MVKRQAGLQIDTATAAHQAALWSEQKIIKCPAYELRFHTFSTMLPISIAVIGSILTDSCADGAVPVRATMSSRPQSQLSLAERVA
ncbi:MAG TPA: hypothetical protein VE398_25935 [Acidobacteriota bacterium]|nr:hypothetical protein [Acidobacteriota bacterium]